jgi:hypothetical protein
MKYLIITFILIAASHLEAQEAPIRLGDAGGGIPALTRAGNGDVHAFWFDQSKILVQSRRLAGSASFVVINTFVPVVGKDTLNVLLDGAVRNDTVFVLGAKFTSEYYSPLRYDDQAHVYLIAYRIGSTILSDVLDLGVLWLKEVSDDSEYRSEITGHFLHPLGRDILIGLCTQGLGFATFLGGFNSALVLKLTPEHRTDTLVNVTVQNMFHTQTHFVNLTDSSVALLTILDTSYVNGAGLSYTRFDMSGARTDSLSYGGLLFSHSSKAVNRFRLLDPMQNGFQLLWTPGGDTTVLHSFFTRTSRTDGDTLIRSFNYDSFAPLNDLTRDLQIISRQDGRSLILWKSIEYIPGKPDNDVIRYRLIDPTGRPLSKEKILNNRAYRTAIGLDNKFGLCWDNGGTGVFYQELTDDFITATDEPPAEYLPKTPTLSVFPNPLRSTGSLLFSIPSPGNVTLVLYDMLGRKLKTFIDRYENAGRHSAAFSIPDLPSGMYSIVMVYDNLIIPKTVAVMRCGALLSFEQAAPGFCLRTLF